MNFLVIFIVLPMVLWFMRSAFISILRHKERQEKIKMKDSHKLIQQAQQVQRWKDRLESKAEAKRVQQENHEKKQQRKDIKAGFRHARREEKYQERKNRYEQNVENKRIQRINKEQEKQQRKDIKTDRKHTRKKAGVDRPLT